MRVAAKRQMATPSAAGHRSARRTAAEVASGLPSPNDGYGKHDGTVNILDIAWLMPPYFGKCSSDSLYSERKDFNGDGTVNILDIVRLTPPTFGESCTL